MFTLFGEERCQELAVEPGFGAVVVVLRQVSQPGQGLEPLEHQFHLPSKTVPLQDRVGIEAIVGKGREQDHVSGVFEGFRFRGLAGLACLPSDPVVRLPNRLFGLPDRADPALDRVGGGGRHGPGPDHAGAVQGRQRRPEVERRTVPGDEAKAAGVDPDRDMAAAGRDMGDALRRGVATVGKHEVPGRNRELPERLSGPLALGGGDPEMVADQRRQGDAVMDAPQGAGLAGFLDRRRVEGPHLEAGLARDRDAQFAEQRQAQGPKPRLRLSQPLHQRHVRKVRKPGLPGPDRGLPQRMPAAKMDQQDPKQALRILVLAQPLQGSRRNRELVPFRGKEAQEQCPVLVHGLPPKCRPLANRSRPPERLQTS